MDFKIIFCVVFLAFCSSASADCSIIKRYTSCNYTVFCEQTPTSVGNPSCDNDPYVIFIITKSHLSYLTTGYFSSTNFDSRVREIIAKGNSWNIIDGSGFRYYPNTIKVDISNSSIEKISNEAFRNLIHLEYLNISNNWIRRLNPKSFYTSDSVANAVKILDLSNNMLQELSSELNLMPNLVKLYLQNNMLSSLTDDSFVNLKHLEHLNLRNNRLQNLNLTLMNLKMLKTIDISHNSLLKLSGYEINRMAGLVYFNASHNMITSVESNCFNQAKYLESIDFSYNGINTTIESVLFEANSRLHYLNFSYNFIRGIQDNSFINTNLFDINLENNNITGTLNENTFKGIIDISNLDLSRQNIDGIKNRAFSSMRNLMHLNLSRNNIKEIENFSFYSSSMMTLDLSQNKIHHLNFLQNCLFNLTELYLNDNNITVVQKNIFANQSQIVKLDLSMNGIISIEPNSLPLNNLQYLNIEGNNLNGVIKKNIFSPAKYLKFLDLSNFNLSKIDDSAFINLNVLARLNLSNNHIESIAANNFKGVNNMFSLDISQNNLTYFSFNNSESTNNLTALYLNNNRLSNISKLFLNTSKLIYLELSNNIISNTTFIDSHLFPNLKVLHLGNNTIKEFNNPKTDSLSTLIDLDVSSNELNDINLSYFKELMSANLGNNKLAHINITSFRNNEYLQSLDVSRNNITDLPPGTFLFMKNLKLLNISSNYLTKLRFGSLKGLHKTEVLDLSKNYISVLDVDVFHECDDLKTLIIDYNRIKTLDVERLILISVRKLRTLSIGGNPIACKEIVHNIKANNVSSYTVREVEVTSIDKIYHEDNVHGIKCGDDGIDDKSNASESKAKNSTENTPSAASPPLSTTAVLVWCSALTLLIIGVGLLIYIKVFRQQNYAISNNMTMQMRNSIVSENSDFQRDLLS
ncbi:protein artichoke-like [Spodoptera litura]|uniref:Protein artichoke-like n=1 Tax=Spodoptera litura TaxID=69820 RepID=A0A9J7EE02_SPOLT|nr:protein artichoke-like [Spodoptera litura]